jgi:DNA-binding transcriptional MerR regulator
MTQALTEQHFTQGDVLEITRLKKELLQTWMNRGVVTLGEQNPGSGRRRLYSALDIVKLGLMRRIADLGMELGIGRDFAEDAERLLLSGRGLEWEYHVPVRRKDATHEAIKVTIIGPSNMSPLTLKYGGTVGDARDMRVSQFTEPFEGTGILDRRVREMFKEDRPIDPERRVALAKAGFYAEPVLIFPFGEVVNGTLLQIAAKCESTLPALAESLAHIADGRRRVEAKADDED